MRRIVIFFAERHFFREHRRLPDLAEAQSIIATLRREQDDLIEATRKASK